MRKGIRMLVVASLIWIACGIVADGCPVGVPGSCILTVGFFNALRFGHGGSYCKDIEQFAEVFESYDLVGLGEVMRNTGSCDDYEAGDLGHLAALVNRLRVDTGYPWAYVPSPTGVGSSGYKEYYAFVYRADRVTCTSSGAFYPDPSEQFVRNPFFVSFRSGDFDFTAVVVHIYWGDGNDDPIAEVEALDDVWAYAQGLDASENDILLMGDFNVHTPSASAFGDLYTLGVDPLLSGSGIRTTYSTGTSAVGASWYDNIWIDLHYTGHEFTGGSGVDYLHRRFFLDASWPHLEVRASISDHCPVWVQFFISQGDDDPSAE
jgi:endonuclease/exonuclease/phosphatase family metal-dependent hydrolase